MSDGWHMPGQTEISHLRVKDSRLSPAPELRRLLWNNNRSDWSRHNLSKAGLDLLAHSFSINIARNHNEDIIWDISSAIVPEYIITRDPIEYPP
jgi:hypothetical protein